MEQERLRGTGTMDVRGYVRDGDIVLIWRFRLAV
jgi:hypothetical protein